MIKQVSDILEHHKVCLESRPFDDEHMEDVHAALINTPPHLQPLLLTDLYEMAISNGCEALCAQLVEYGILGLSPRWLVHCALKVIELPNIQSSIISDNEKGYRDLTRILSELDFRKLEDFFSAALSASTNISNSIDQLRSIDASLKLLKIEFNKRGIDDNACLNLALQASYIKIQHSDDSDLLVERINNFFPSATPTQIMFGELQSASSFTRLNGFRRAFVELLNSLSVSPLDVRKCSIISGHLSSFPGACIQALRDETDKIISCSNPLFVERILNGDWLDKADEQTTKSARHFITSIVEDPLFASLPKSSSLSTFMGTKASIISANLLSQLGLYVISPSSSYGESLQVSMSASKHIGHMTKEELQMTKEIIMNTDTAKNFIELYNYLIDMDGSIKRTSSPAEKVQIVSVLFMTEKKHGKLLDGEFSIAEIGKAIQSVGSMFFQVDGFCKLSMEGMTQDELISVAPRNEYYLCALIKDGLVDKKNLSRLSPTGKKLVVSQDLDI